MARAHGDQSTNGHARPLSLGVLAWIITLCTATSNHVVRADPQPADQGDFLVIQLVHPERQAAALINLFDGARVKHPAAALAAWKLGARTPKDLGKPVEALIALFNPEMTDEWRVMHGARIGVNWDAASARTAWHAIVPHDDGTIAAAVAAMQLSDGAAEPALGDAKSPIAVERLGRPGAILAARSGDTLIFGSTRPELARAARVVPEAKANSPAFPNVEKPLVSGARFILDANRLGNDPGQPLTSRAVGELLRGLSCPRVEGSLALEGDSLGLDVRAIAELKSGADAALWNNAAPIEAAWLECIPASHAMAVIALAFRPTPEFWDAAFALADRLEKADPARAKTAPMRARLNFMARTAGVRLEADVWPHLRGLTTGIFGKPGRPGRPTGVLVALHLDSEAAADQIVARSGPGLAKLIGREVTVWCKGRSVFVAWGAGVAAAARDMASHRERSVAPLCTHWSRTGKPATPPSRLVVFWPARCWPLEHKPITPEAAYSVLMEDPPALWLGWNEKANAVETVRWSGLNLRVRRFLDQLPLEPVSAIHR